MKIKSGAFRKIKNAIGGRLHSWVRLFDVSDIHQRALTERDHRKRSVKVQEMILPFVGDKDRFIFLAEALEGYFDFQRAVEIKDIIDAAKITLVATHDAHKVFVYHDGKLIGEA